MPRDYVYADTVFPSSGEPKYTYQVRGELEDRLREYADHGSGILLVHGPTKAGKSVLVARILRDAVFVRGDASTAAGLWAAVATRLNLFTGRSVGASTEDTVKLSIGARIDAVVAAITGRVAYEARTGATSGATATDDPQLLVHDALVGSRRVLVIDDFHFLPRAEQRSVMATVKGIVDEGGRVVLITAGHRAHFVSSLIPNLGGRISDFPVNLWEEDDLRGIARLGFPKLYLEDPGESLATELARQSFGSPQLMQRLCAALSHENGRGKARARRTTRWVELRAPADWSAFFGSTLSPISLEVRWLKALTRGPQERRPRTVYPTADWGPVDGYRLILLALAALLPNMSPTREQIHTQVDLIAGLPGPRRGETTSKLSYLSKLAARSLDANLDEDELDAPSDETALESDPVLEYQDSGPNSVLKLVDPLFAFALRWWSDNRPVAFS